jgi:hypothetical protein
MGSTLDSTLRAGLPCLTPKPDPAQGVQGSTTAVTQELDRPWVNGMQAGFYLRRLQNQARRTCLPRADREEALS